MVCIKNVSSVSEKYKIFNFIQNIIVLQKRSVLNKRNKIRIPKGVSHNILFSFIYFFGGLAQELIVGEEIVDPGIKFIFEGAIKDVISPSSRNLSQELTNVHIEARVNWDNENIPDGAVPGGFIPYLRINSFKNSLNLKINLFKK